MIAEAIIRRNSLFGSVGKVIAHNKYPNDFELYTMALELVYLNTDESIAYFVFPILPSSISMDSTNRDSVINTQGGITVLRSSISSSVPIMIQGNFGRSLKYLIGNTYRDIVSGISSFKDIIRGFDKNIKTGYGCTKILEDLVSQVKIVDEKGPRALILYNFTFNQKVYIQVTGLKINMDMQSNMIWNYSLSAKILGDISSYRGGSESQSLTKRLSASSFIQNTANATLNLI